MVHRIELTNIVLHIAMSPYGSVDKPLDVHIPRIKLGNVGTGSDQGVQMSELTGVITGAIFRTLVKEAPGAIPAPGLGSLDLALSQASDFGEWSGNLVGQVSEQLIQQTEKVLEDLGKAADDLGEDTKKDVDEVLKGLGGLVPG